MPLYVAERWYTDFVYRGSVVYSDLLRLNHPHRLHHLSATYELNLLGFSEQKRFLSKGALYEATLNGELITEHGAT